jgi:hypothetical protein
MTNVGMFEDAETIKYLEEQNKFLKKKLREAINSKAIDTLETDIGIKDWHIQKRFQKPMYYYSSFRHRCMASKETNLDCG